MLRGVGVADKKRKFPTGIVAVSALGIVLLALGIGFTPPIGELSKLGYGGNLWCVSNYIQKTDSQGKPVYDTEGKPIDDPRLTGKGNLIRRDQVSAEGREQAEQKAVKNGFFEKSTREELGKALDSGDTSFFVSHFNTGATSPGPCLGSGSLQEGSWINDVIRKRCSAESESSSSSSSSSSAIGSDNYQAQIKLIENTSIAGSAKSAVNAQHKIEIISQIKAVYLDLVQRYPEIRTKRLSSIVIAEEDESDQASRGHLEEKEGTNACKMTLDFDLFGQGSEVTGALKDAEFHEFLHCWTGGLPFSIGEEVVWPISANYSGLSDPSAVWYKLWVAITDIFIARGDEGDRWRILMAVIGEGRKGLDKRLSYLPLSKLPGSYSSPTDYLDSLGNSGDVGDYDKAIKWLKSKTPPPADYRTYKFSASGGKVPASDVPSSYCPKETPGLGPSEGQDYQAIISSHLNQK
jgi:hypothetical protein